MIIKCYEGGDCQMICVGQVFEKHVDSLRAGYDLRVSGPGKKRSRTLKQKPYVVVSERRSPYKTSVMWPQNQKKKP